MKEAATVRALRERLKGRALVYKNSGGRFAKSGRPDVEVVFRRKFGDPSLPATVAFIEFKQPGEKPTEIQSREHARLRDVGALVGVAHSWAEAIDLLRDWGME